MLADTLEQEENSAMRMLLLGTLQACVVPLIDVFGDDLIECKADNRTVTARLLSVLVYFAKATRQMEGQRSNGCLGSAL